MLNASKKLEMPTPEQAPPGRAERMPITNQHFVKGTPIQPPFPENLQTAMFGMGCFWGAERKYWELEGVYSTAVGYAGGYTPNPSYEEICSGLTGHNEVVFVVFDPEIISYEHILKTFWESHNPTQYMRQGNDIGTQYRSTVYYYNDAQKIAAQRSKEIYRKELFDLGHGEICSEILPVPELYYAEDYHQQYLAKNPNGYCGLGGTGVTCPIGISSTG